MESSKSVLVNRNTNNKTKNSKKTLKMIPMIVIIGFLLLSQTNDVNCAARINSFGGYEDLVVSIENNVPNAHCQQLLSNIQVNELSFNNII